MNSRIRLNLAKSAARALQAVNDHKSSDSGSAHFAVLYRGSFSFSYGHKSGARTTPTTTGGKRISPKLTRRRTKQASGDSYDDDWDDEALDSSPFDPNRAYVNEHGGSREQQHGQRQNDQASAEAVTFRSVKGNAKQPSLPSAFNVLGGSILEKEFKITSADALRNAWVAALLTVVKGMREPHAAPEQAQEKLIKLMLDWHLAEQRYGPLPEMHLSVLQEHATTGSALNMSDAPRRPRDIFFLIPLVLLHASAPLTTRQRKQAICTLATFSTSVANETGETSSDENMRSAVQSKPPHGD